MIVCAGESENFEFAKSIGIGLTQVAVNLTKILQDIATRNEKLPNEIIFIGSAGLYKNGEILKIYESKNAANIEISSLEGKSYTPIEQKIFNDVSYETNVNSSTFITTDETLAHRLFDMGYTLENMEFYAVLAVANAFNVSTKGIFVATNFCDKNAHIDFIKNHKNAKRQLEIYLKDKGII
ncbi:purine-nucleoside phosphorylase [Campylobacter sp. faydin G-105]|uniref:purine-nucleoside phosphorylase n=1 Tax=Campylobacter anatolicus TaxID=2829105 RepID=UPI001B9997CB|nr:purine-nucleoside phosphorylase [Campylobacter anatolicus]MBR8461399.1 purine-nucleoside phosphorylase [Campylobacter anatolicus]